MAKLMISIPHSKNDTDKATVGFVVANASVASGVETAVWLSVEGVRLAVPGYADDIHEEGFAPLKKLMDDFVDAGGIIYLCSPCVKKRKIDEANLINGATIVGGAKVVEFLTSGASCITY